MKTYYTMNNIGKCKYCVFHNDGIETHKDGSLFYGVAIFKNKPSLNAFINKLVSDNYNSKHNY